MNKGVDINAHNVFGDKSQTYLDRMKELTQDGSRKPDQKFSRNKIIKDLRVWISFFGHKGSQQSLFHKEV